MKWLLLLVVSAPALARPAVPLMPLAGSPTLARTEKKTATEKKTTVVQRRTAYLAPQSPSYVATRVDREEDRKLGATGLGFELGILGRSNSTQADIAGLQMLGGLRVFARYSLTENIFILPSLGGFFRHEGPGNTSVNQFLIEGGATAYYNFWLSKKTRWLVGGTIKGEYAISSISAGGSNASSGSEFRFRAGPATGLAIGISPEWSAVVDVELCLVKGQDVRFQPGAAFGLIRYFP